MGSLLLPMVVVRDLKVRIQVQSGTNGTAGTVAVDNISIINPGSRSCCRRYVYGNLSAQLGVVAVVLTLPLQCGITDLADDGYPDNPDKGMMAQRLRDCRNLVGYTDAADPSASQIGVAVKPTTLSKLGN